MKYRNSTLSPSFNTVDSLSSDATNSSLIETVTYSGISKKLAPVLGNAEDDYEDKIKVYKVNTNFDVELAEQYEVQANPTLILFKDGQAKDRKTGALKQAELNSWIEGLL